MTLACVMLVGSIAGSGIVTVQARYAPLGGESPEQPYFTLWAVITPDPYWGFYGGYHDILYALRPELAKIGIDLSIAMYDQYTWWDIVWETYWNLSSADALPPFGWDLFISEWWMMPTGLIPLESLVYSWATPPAGRNIMPWMNENADELLWKGMHTLSATEREDYLWRWQELFMHDPSMVNLYYPRPYEVTTVWLEGWDPVVGFRDVSHLAINQTLFDLYAPPGREYGTLIYGLGGDCVWSYNPLFIKTSAEQRMCSLWFETLYDLSLDPWPPTGTPPAQWDFYSKPALAETEPIFMEGPNGNNTRVRVPLRENVYWSNGNPFNATDVKFTFDLILNPVTKAVAYGDLSPVVESVKYVPGEYTDPYTGQNYDPWVVDFILYEPYPDLATLLSNEWGLAIIPYQPPFYEIKPANLKAHPSNWDWQIAKYLPALGPFKLEEVWPGEYIRMVRNPLYFGYGENHPELDWGPYDVETMILKWVPDPSMRGIEMKKHRIDFGDTISEPIEAFRDFQEQPDFNVWKYDGPSSNNLFFNLDNPYLSNRYVRQAMAHAVPYGTIFYEILPSWGIEPYAGKTPILPHHYYTDPSTNETVHLFNEELEPFEYNITKAEMYMNMWYYAQEGTDYTQGPVGDADFSGVVRLADFLIWAANFGTNGPRPFCPGNDIDPDFDNSGTVNLDDFICWAENYGKHYPFSGAR